MLGVGHETHHVALCVHDAGDVVERSVRVVVVVAEHDLAVGLQLREELRVGGVAAFAVLDGNRQPLTDLATSEERDVERLVSGLAGCPQLAATLGFGAKEVAAGKS